MADDDFDMDMSIGDMPTMGNADDAKLLARIDRYELMDKLGRGAFGAVFLARDTVADTLVALKTLPPELNHSPEDLESVRDNFKLVSKLAHPNICQLKHLHQVESVKSMESGVHISAGEYFVVMEYVEGSTLRNWLRQFPEKKAPLEKAIAICEQVAVALDFAHSQKIIHRDIKPGNIMVSAEGQVKVLDFGLAAEVRSSMSRLSTDKGSSSGTRPYMPPEQLLGKSQDHTADQYALAAMFYEMINGAVPFQPVFETGDMQLILGVIPSQAAEPLSLLDKKQNANLLRALAKTKEERFATCEDFIAAFAGAKVGQPTRTAKSKTPILVLLFLFLAIGGWFAWDNAQKAEAEKLQIAEAQRKATEAKLLAQETEKARLLKEELARKARLEQERLAKEAEMKAQHLAEQEAEKELARKVKLEQDRLAKEAEMKAQRLAEQEAEKARVLKEALARKAKLEQERLAKQTAEAKRLADEAKALAQEAEKVRLLKEAAAISRLEADRLAKIANDKILAATTDLTAVQTIEKATAQFAAMDLHGLLELLPISYKKDIESLIKVDLKKMDQEVYNKTFATLGKLVILLKTKKPDFIALINENMSGQKEQAKAIAESWTPTVDILDYIVKSELNSIETLEAFELSKFAQDLAPKLKGFIEIIMKFDGENSTLADLGKMKFELISEKGDNAVVKSIDFKGKVDENNKLSKIDGKWLPNEMVAGWSSAMTQVKVGMLTKLTPAQKTATLAMLSAIEKLATNLSLSKEKITPMTLQQGIMGLMAEYGSLDQAFGLSK